MPLVSSYTRLRVKCEGTRAETTTQVEAVSPLTPRKYNVLNGKFALDLRNVTEERNPVVKRDLPVLVLL